MSRLRHGSILHVLTKKSEELIYLAMSKLKDGEKLTNSTV